MAQEIREFAVTIPAGTAKTAPVTVGIPFPQRVVTAVSWRVPPGPSGLMGWALTSDGTPVIPAQPGVYLVTDNQAETWPLEGYLDSGNWAVSGYNLGLYPHTVYLTFLLDLPGTAVSFSPPPAGAGASVIGTAGVVTVTSAPPPPTSPAAPSPPAGDGAVVAAVVVMALQQLLAGGVPPAG